MLIHKYIVNKMEQLSARHQNNNVDAPNMGSEQSSRRGSLVPDGEDLLGKHRRTASLRVPADGNIHSTTL
jgi:hypothetical protein